jgi:ABC-2 type transport system permease protein
VLTARFTQPIGAAILYPMVALCGLFVPLQSLPPAAQAVARVLPLTYAVSLLRGIWKGEAWSAHMGDVAALVVVFVICTSCHGGQLTTGWPDFFGSPRIPFSTP